jgi:hypothetical protein
VATLEAKSKKAGGNCASTRKRRYVLTFAVLNYVFA